MFARRGLGVAAAIALGAAAGVAAAETTTISFEDLAVGTIVTTQYDGVTISAPGNSCEGSPVIYPVIATPNGGTSSGTKALSIQTGCPDFSADWLRFVFDDPQSEITFTIGIVAETYQVRAYTTTSGGSPVITQNITLTGSGWLGVHRFVRITRAAGDIRRIELESTVGDFEYIDDLTFACPDTTPPEAIFTAPTFLAEVCGTVLVRGSACDPDGEYVGDKLEYLLAADPDATWTFIDDATTPQCTPNGALYSWNTTGLAQGWYYLRITVRNACNLQSEAVTMVYVDHTFENLTLRTPVTAGIYAGTVVFDGTAHDDWFAQYTVKYRPAGGGVYNPVDTANPVYTPAGGVTTDQLAQWNTATGPTAVTDGNYSVQVVASDACSNSATITRTIVIDNTAPTALLTSPTNCQRVSGTVPVIGTATDTHLQKWTLYYTGGTVHGWAWLAEGVTPIVGGVLHNWNTAGLPQCSYVLRLVVTDTAVIDGGPLTHQTDYLTSVIIGQAGCCPGDCNGDGHVNFADIDPFVALIPSTCP